MRSIFAASSGRSWILPNNSDAHNGPALAGTKRPGTTVAHLMLLLSDAGSGSSRDRLRASSTPLYGTPGDVDDDGGLDLVVVNRDAAANLLINRAQRGHWLRFDVLAAIGRDAYGATVSATVDSRRLTRDVQPSASYLASSDPSECDVSDDVVAAPELLAPQVPDGVARTFHDPGCPRSGR